MSEYLDLAYVGLARRNTASQISQDVQYSANAAEELESIKFKSSLREWLLDRPFYSLDELFDGRPCQLLQCTYIV